MIAIPAVDIREGACVQLVGGEYTKEKVRRPDPAEVVREWVAFGFQRVHIVDLDAATGRGNNRAVIRGILADAAAPMQVGGGVRDDDRFTELVDDGAEWVVVGTRAIDDFDWIADLAESHPGQVIVAADVRERRVVTQGWAKTTGRDIDDVVEELNDLPLAGLLVTAVHREGKMQGTDLPLMESVAESCRFPVIASGGITTMDDLRALQHRGAAGAVIGMALYTGVLDPRAVAEEFA
ncbi:MAG: 1-(5-phosphoribosyl)-5-[(5-phosphoribosylamino)methylideneamino] imidazole-4-carboxamide isomerase [Gemmatimonadaceae bacterium]|nr:1-(5-phosphoribosyl)-5-[(5-phosphoribosylamino)methylideneamino] imidazole-4-carboxamide isomerase [Gemmatimonadaceae bacterium]